MEDGKLDTGCKIFAKDNEIHEVDSDPRPRLIFNPNPALKVVGSYVARMIVKILKRDAYLGDSFISGITDQEFRARIVDRLNKGDHWLSYDGSGHDAH